MQIQYVSLGEFATKQDLISPTLHEKSNEAMNKQTLLLFLMVFAITSCNKEDQSLPCDQITLIENPTPALQVGISNPDIEFQAVKGMIHSPYGLILAHGTTMTDSVFCLDASSGQRKWAAEMPRSTGSTPNIQIEEWNHIRMGSILLIGQGPEIFQLDLIVGAFLPEIKIEGEVCAIYPSDITGTCLVTSRKFDTPTMTNIYTVYLFDQEKQKLEILIQESSKSTFFFGLHHLVRMQVTNQIDTILCYITFISLNDKPILTTYNLTKKAKKEIAILESPSFGVPNTLDLTLSDNLLIVFDQPQEALIAFDLHTGNEVWRQQTLYPISKNETYIYAAIPEFGRIRIQDGFAISTQINLPTPYNVVATPAYHLTSKWLNPTEKFLFRNTSGCNAMIIAYPGTPDGSPRKRSWSSYNWMDQDEEKIYLTDGYDLFIYNMP